MDIIQMTRDLGTAIQESAEYKRITSAKATNDNDAELQNLIETFNMTRVKLSAEMQKEEKSDEQIAEYDNELKGIYAKVMDNKNMTEFNDAKQEIDQLMTKINTILVAAVNGEDPQSCEEEPAHSCGGGCSSCSGCH